MILNRMPRPSGSKHRLYVSSSSQTRQSRAADAPVILFHFLTGEQQFPIWNGCAKSDLENMIFPAQISFSGPICGRISGKFISQWTENLGSLPYRELQIGETYESHCC